MRKAVKITEVIFLYYVYLFLITAVLNKLDGFKEEPFILTVVEARSLK